MPLPAPVDTSRNPGLWEKSEEKYGEAGTIAVVPMPDLEAMLNAALPNTRVTILKIPFESTTKQR